MRKKNSSVRNLKRTSLPIPNIYGKSEPKKPHNIHGGFLCHDSDWKPTFGKPFKKAILGFKKENAVDLICVAKSNFFELNEDNQIKHNNTQVTLFFLRLFSILQQKGTVPMIDIMAYAKHLS